MPYQGYSADLKWRVVWQREVMGYSISQTTESLGVSAGFVSQVHRTFRKFGLVEWPKEARHEAVGEPGPVLTELIKQVITLVSTC